MLLKNGIKEISDRPLERFHHPVFPFCVSAQLLLLNLLQLSSPSHTWQPWESSALHEAVLLSCCSAKAAERFMWLPWQFLLYNPVLWCCVRKEKHMLREVSQRYVWRGKRGSKSLRTAEGTHALICRQADMLFLSAQSQMLSSKAFKALIIDFKLSNPPTNPLPQE